MANLLLRELCPFSPFPRLSVRIPSKLIRIHVGIGLIRPMGEGRAFSAGSEPTPRITIGEIMSLLVMQEVGDLVVKMSIKEKNCINKDGELVISSTKTRTQKGNIEDALEKLQAIINAASYVPPPPSEEQKERIEKLAAIGEQKRIQNKKALSQKKAIRRNRDSWD